MGEYIYVYIICTESLICKIGCSIDPLERMRIIQKQYPSELELVHLIRPKDALWGRILEYQLHEHYKKVGKHIRGEWFQLSGADLKRIAAHWPDFKDQYRKSLSLVLAPVSVVESSSDEELDRLMREVEMILAPPSSRRTELDRQLTLSNREFEREVWAKHVARVRRHYSASVG